MPYKKLNPVDKKTSHVAGSINATTKAQKKKIDNAKLDMSLPKVKYSDIYIYLKKNWQYKGKSCMLCGTVMNDPYVLEHHHYVCNVNKQKHTGTDID
jgi:hypothetical protein